MNKIEKDGMIAVLYSPGYGAGWSTWNSYCKETLCMDSEIVQAVIDGDINKAIEVALKKCPDIYTGGAEDLVVEWVKKGDMFEISEYDGNESIRTFDASEYMIA